MHTNPLNSVLPGEGRRAPRADAVTDARTQSLNGRWRFRLSPTAAGSGTGFVADDFDDSGWDTIRVPSHWVLEPITPPGADGPRSLLGTAEGPLYTNTAFPIPLDPPHVPEENPTGDYRLEFDTDIGAGVLRFQGVDSCATVWLNGERLGWTTGSRLQTEFDVRLRPDRNILAVRVHRWSPGTYLEDQDMWWLPGIFRDVELIERLPGAIDDHFVHADYDHQRGLGTLRVDADVAAVVTIPELDLVLAAGETATVAVEPWSAESPRLYRGTLATQTESVALAIGFRTVTIDDGRLLINGSPVFFRGVNRHEQDWERGRALDRDTMVRDILEMKRHNINAVRTSHYPPHPEFLRLCDELGLWVVEECDLETHGFIYAGWEGNPPTEPEWLPAMLDRIQRMVERDKNRPSVVIWSMANESWTGANFDALEAWIRDRDPSRPILYERDPSYRNSDFYSVMYPDLERLEAIGRREEERPDGVSDEEDARRRTLPFLLCEYAHAMGNGPGSLHDYHRIMRSHPRICGGFVWEWIDHGFRHVDEAGNGFVMHGGDVAYRPNGGRYCLDGLLFADRTPGPGLAELASVLQPVEIEPADGGVQIRNAQDFVDTTALRFEWLLEHDGVRVGGGELAVPNLAPGETAHLPLPAQAGADPGDWWLTVRGLQRQDTAWAPAGHLVARGQWALARNAPAPAVGRAVAPRQAEGTVVLGPGEFDADSGALIRLGGVPVDGPRLDLYRAPTENDRGQGDRNNLASVWQAVGLDRLQHRTDSVRIHDDGLEVVVRTSSSTHPHAADTVLCWSCVDDVLHLGVTVDFVGPWRDTPYMHRDIIVPRLGLRLALPGDYGRAEWFGLGPGENYVDSTAAAAMGRHSSTIDDLQVDYPTPQENGNRMGVRWLALAGDGLPTLRFLGPDDFAFTARRWTSEALERARHPHDLVDSGLVWLNLDHAQQGIGSASVGPALPERYRIPLTRTSWRVAMTVD